MLDLASFKEGLGVTFFALKGFFNYVPLRFISFAIFISFSILPISFTMHFCTQHKIYPTQLESLELCEPGFVLTVDCLTSLQMQRSSKNSILFFFSSLA